jgi:hypothetical protein
MEGRMTEEKGRHEQGAREPDQIEHAIYCLLTVRDEQRPWSLHEVDLVIGDGFDARDAVRNLEAAGLVHVLGGFVWATRAALAADAMCG